MKHGVGSLANAPKMEDEAPAEAFREEEEDVAAPPVLELGAAAVDEGSLQERVVGDVCRVL